MSKIGEYISEKRIEKNITQKKLAELLCVSASAVSKWENGVAIPHISSYPLIAKVLEVPIEELYALTRSEFTEPAVEFTKEELLEEDYLPDPKTELSQNKSVEFPMDNETASHKPRQNKCFLFVAICVGILATVIIILSFVLMLHKRAEPKLQIVKEYYGEDGDSYLYYTNLYYVVIECDGQLNEEFLQSYKKILREKYTPIFDNVEAVVVLFYEDYSEEKINIVPVMELILLPIKKE